MNKEQTLAAIAVMQAYVDGRTIEFSVKSHTPATWQAYHENCSEWDFNIYNYRIKPEPREYWVVTNVDGSQYVLFSKPSQAWIEVVHVREIIE